MVKALWKKFIQINIYDRTLNELKTNGIDLQGLLTEIGCSRNWITEGTLYSGGSDSGFDSSSEETMPILSSTIATNQVPRFSTPINSRIERKLTFNATRDISRVHSDSEEEDEENELSMTSAESKNILTESEKSFENENELIIQDLVEEILFNLDSENIQENGTNYENETGEVRILLNNLIFDMQTGENFVHAKNIKKSLSTIIEPTTVAPTVTKNKSENLMKLNIQKTVKELNPRKKLKRTTSEIRRDRNKTLKIAKRRSIHSIPFNNQEKPEFPAESLKPIVVTDEQLNSSSEKVYCDLTPISSGVDFQNPILTYPDPPLFYNQYDNMFNYEYNEQNQELNEIFEKRKEEEEEEEESFNNYADAFDAFDIDDTLRIEENHEVPSSLITPVKPILSSSENMAENNNKEVAKNVKKVSFAVQVGSNIVPMTNETYQKYINESHRIKCGYPGCNQTYNWKIKYGKLRLLDHALSHTPNRYLKCRLCDFSSYTSRQLRHHYSMKHPTEKPHGYGMKDIHADDMDIRAIWRGCYENQLDLVGQATSKEKHTRLKRKRKEANSDSSGAEEASEPLKDYFWYQN